MATDHSVPRKVTPKGESRKTSQPLTLTSAPTAEISFFPASSCSRVDFPAMVRSILFYFEQKMEMNPIPPFAPIRIVREPGMRLKLRSTRHGGEDVL